MAAASITLLYFIVLGLLIAGIVPAWVIKFHGEFKLKNDASVGDLATLLVAVTSLLTVCIGWFQFRELGRQSRATVLLTINARWESTGILALRTYLGRFQDTAAKLAATNGVNFGTAASGELKRMRDTVEERDSYSKLIEMCGFFETLGLVTRSRYVDPKDAFNLLGGSIMVAGLIFEDHIQDVQNTNSRHYFEHFVWLLTDARRREAEDEGYDD